MLRLLGVCYILSVTTPHVGGVARGVEVPLVRCVGCNRGVTGGKHGGGRLPPPSGVCRGAVTPHHRVWGSALRKKMDPILGG